MYWCFLYEAKNQEVKRAVECSNYKNPAATAMDVLAKQHARRLRKRRRDYGRRASPTDGLRVCP